MKKESTLQTPATGGAATTRKWHLHSLSTGLAFSWLLLSSIVSSLPAVSGFVRRTTSHGWHLIPSFVTVRPPATSPNSWRQSLAVVRLSASSSSLRASDTWLDDEEDDSETVCTITSPCGQQITLIGTAHLSQKSNEQVTRLIQEIRPNVVMVELDPTRLHRIGISSIQDIKMPKVVTSQDIELPLEDNSPTSLAGKLFRPFWLVQEAVTDAISRLARAFLTGMYEDMGQKMNNPKGGGGEFLAAIRAAEQIPECTTLVLGDRSSVTTIKRAAMLALQSGDPLGVLARLQQVNLKEMQLLEVKVRDRLQLQQEQKGEPAVDETQVQVAMMEALKVDSLVRNRLFGKLEQQVPEFTQAFLKERDYIMAEAIRRELLDAQIQRVVGVVGLGHLPGMEETLRAMFANETVPLLLMRGQTTSSS